MSQCKNHQHCIDTAISNALLACQEANVRLTPLREQLLKLIWKSHQPLGAYDLIEMLAEVSERCIAPPTVYRTLNFLLNVGLIHRINSLNAFIGCTDPSTRHPSYFLICTECQTATECHNDSLRQQVSHIGTQTGFRIQQQWLEVLGLCQNCQKL
ncbi:Fur family transcriptional regulator [Candidatus Endobugula sertula]|uniref:Ferric uptake regulation protein n=1 Tax=Candidatus Endobugula sertula TaxID=62101 RepID=A0A1D2QR55_9GAMM|nr:Fur family transcriptional regulator [Candidatus Endobugula sertula]